MSLLKKALDIIPTAVASRVFGAISDIQFSPRVQHHINSAFTLLAGVNMSDSVKSIDEFSSLNELFTREIRPESRPVGDSDVISPVDGRISFMGRISDGCLIEAKGHEYQVRDLVGTHQASLTDWLDDAYAFTIYLAPYNYHRIHMPMTGRVTHYTYAPGRLLPVNRIGYMISDDLLPENERLTSFIKNDNGKKCALVKVGATCVGRISVVYNDFKTNTSLLKSPFSKDLCPEWNANAGDQLACFELGSTVVLLLSGENFKPAENLCPGQKISMGTSLGSWI